MAGHSIQDFIPEKWTIRDSVSGMLNNRTVYALVIQFQDTVVWPKKIDGKILHVKTFPRTLLVVMHDSIPG